MTSQERLDHIRAFCQKDEGHIEPLTPADIEEEMACFRRDEEIRDDITMACIDAVFEGGQ